MNLKNINVCEYDTHRGTKAKVPVVTFNQRGLVQLNKDAASLFLPTERRFIIFAEDEESKFLRMFLRVDPNDKEAKKELRENKQGWAFNSLGFAQMMMKRLGAGEEVKFIKIKLKAEKVTNGFIEMELFEIMA